MSYRHLVSEPVRLVSSLCFLGSADNYGAMEILCSTDECMHKRCSLIYFSVQFMIYCMVVCIHVTISDCSLVVDTDANENLKSWTNDIVLAKNNNSK